MSNVPKSEFDAFMSSAVVDLNALRDSIIRTADTLDVDAGVATDTYAATCTPPPIITVPGGGSSNGGIGSSKPGQVLFNSNNTVAGSDKLLFDDASGQLTLGGRSGNIVLTPAAAGFMAEIRGVDPGDPNALAGLSLKGSGQAGYVDLGHDSMPPFPTDTFSWDVGAARAVAGAFNQLGLVISMTSKDQADASTIGGFFTAWTSGGLTNGQVAQGLMISANSFAVTGVTDYLACGLYAISGTSYNGGNLEAAISAYAYVQAGSGNIDAADAMLIDSAYYYGGTITDLCGLRIKDQAGASGSNCAIKTGIGAVEFGDLVNAVGYRVGGVEGANFSGVPASITVVNGLVTAVQ